MTHTHRKVCWLTYFHSGIFSDGQKVRGGIKLIVGSGLAAVPGGETFLHPPAVGAQLPVGTCL